MSDDRADDNDGVEQLLPYLGLAREIRAEVERFVADDAATAESLQRVLGGLPERALAEVASSVFAQLSASEQWALLAAAVGDDRLRTLVARAHDAEAQAARRRVAAAAMAATARAEGQLDLRVLPAGTVVTVLLFRPQDVDAVLGRAVESDVCARELVLVATGRGGILRVVADRFNPRRGLFVTADYDESVWAAERLHGHDEVRLGSRAAGGPFEPVVRPGARMDVEAERGVTHGRLHVGGVLVDGEEVASGS